MSSSRQSRGSSRHDTLQPASAAQLASRSTGSSPSDASPVLGERPDMSSAGKYQTIASLMASRQSGAPPATVYQPSPPLEVPLEVTLQPIELQSPAARPLQSVAMARMRTPANTTARSPMDYRAVMQQPITQAVAVPEQRLYDAVTPSHHQHPYHWAQMPVADMPEHHGLQPAHAAGAYTTHWQDVPAPEFGAVEPSPAVKSRSDAPSPSSHMHVSSPQLFPATHVDISHPQGPSDAPQIPEVATATAGMQQWPPDLGYSDLLPNLYSRLQCRQAMRRGKDVRHLGQASELLPRHPTCLSHYGMMKSTLPACSSSVSPSIATEGWTASPLQGFCYSLAVVSRRNPFAEKAETLKYSIFKPWRMPTRAALGLMRS
ncbi:hypothetical protein S40288_10800 [Stachybotrys chartarum IBT 40288]|nr:hypothetical protein S40288_10800 [Stachybotrys chartarum IBT 40288]